MFCSYIWCKGSDSASVMQFSSIYFSVVKSIYFYNLIYHVFSSTVCSSPHEICKSVSKYSLSNLS